MWNGQGNVSTSILPLHSPCHPVLRVSAELQRRSRCGLHREGPARRQTLIWIEWLSLDEVLQLHSASGSTGSTFLCRSQGPQKLMWSRGVVGSVTFLAMAMCVSSLFTLRCSTARPRMRGMRLRGGGGIPGSGRGLLRLRGGDSDSDNVLDDSGRNWEEVGVQLTC